MRKILAPAFVWLLSTSLVFAQSVPGKFQANRIFAGPTSGGEAPPAPRALVAADMPTGTSYFDSTYCSTFGYMIVRLTGAWTCSNSIPIPVNWFGADPTAAVTSSAAFNAAVAACTACTIRVPSTNTGGSYLLSTQVTIAKSQVFFQCDPGVTIINGTTNAAALYFGDGVSQYFSSGLDGCTFAQKSGVSPTAGNYGVVWNKVGQFRASNFVITSFPSALQNGVLFQAASQAEIVNMQVQNTVAVGVDFEALSLDIYGLNWRSDSNGTVGFQINDSQGFYVTNAAGFNNGTNAWNLGSVGGCSEAGPAPFCNQNIFIMNGIGDTSGNANWQISYCKVCTFVNMWGSTQKSAAINVFANGLLLQPGAASAIRNFGVIGGNFIANNGSGVNIFDAGSGIPNYVLFSGVNFGDAVHGNGRGGSGGTGLNVSNSAGTVEFTGGSEAGNASGAFSFGAATTVYGFCTVVGFSCAPNVQTAATYTVLPTDAEITANVAGTLTLTLPAPAISVGRVIPIRTTANQAVVSASSNVVPLVGGAAGTAILAATAGKWARLVSDGTSWQIGSSN